MVAERFAVGVSRTYDAVRSGRADRVGPVPHEVPRASLLVRFDLLPQLRLFVSAAESAAAGGRRPFSDPRPPAPASANALPIARSAASRHPWPRIPA
ncbi:MAG TPA: hypothetical protein DCQ98_01460 [Planctomycetaceae bacterium]|nr:hypothetical protein [Planctomycetaceae bacterium]